MMGTALTQVLESPLEKKAGVNYGPPGTKQLIYFVDDLNMPKLDPYETAMPISLIRQHLGWGHWFDRCVQHREPTVWPLTHHPRAWRSLGLRLWCIHHIPAGPSVLSIVERMGGEVASLKPDSLC
jgi:hypothetical protein